VNHISIDQFIIKKTRSHHAQIVLWLTHRDVLADRPVRPRVWRVACGVWRVRLHIRVKRVSRDVNECGGMCAIGPI
jgi:hypothetical protein